jgi:hypothetical protein
MIGARQ